MERRLFVQELALLGAAAGVSPRTVLAADDAPTARRVPRWRGFNLQGRFGWPGRPYEGPAYEEADFAMIAEWGFEFARLPLAYWAWGSRDDWSLVREEPLAQIDRAVELGKQYGIHVDINFHRIPGYCINGRELEPADLFSGRKAERDRALAAAVFHWKTFATRYKGIPSRRLSFDLINEPPWVKPYEGYLVERYDEIVRALAWMGDYLALWKEAGWGWALWNLRGDFGILDSNRADVRYEDYKGHKLDRKMLELLRSS